MLIAIESCLEVRCFGVCIQKEDVAVGQIAMITVALHWQL